MPAYRYTARDHEGRQLTGTQDAESEDEVVKILQGRGLLITQITRAGLEGGLSKRQRRHRRVKGSDLLILTEELSTLLGSGVSLLRALEIATPQITSMRLLSALEIIKDDIRSGSSFHEAVEKHPRVFPSVWATIIEAGEVSGNLPVVLGDLCRHLYQNEELKKKVISALIYPALLICVALGALALFLLKIIPIFAQLFDNFGAELPLLTRAVIGFSDFLRHYLWLIVLSGGGGVYFARRYFRTRSGRERLDQWLLRLPLFGALLQDAILARIGINFSILVKSGVNFLKALDITARVAGNSVFEKSIQRLRDDVQTGMALSEAMEKSPLFSNLVVQMIQVGEEVGKMEEMMARVGEHYEGRVNTFVSRLSTLVEPAILIVVGGIVGVLIVSMFLPIFSLSNLIR